MLWHQCCATARPESSPACRGSWVYAYKTLVVVVVLWIYADEQLGTTMTRGSNSSLQVIRALSANPPSVGYCGVECGVRIRTQHNFSLHDGTVHIARSRHRGGDEARLNASISIRDSTRRHKTDLLTTSGANAARTARHSLFPQALPISIVEKSLTPNRRGAVADDVKSVCDEVSVTKRLLKYADPLSEKRRRIIDAWPDHRYVFRHPLSEVSS